MSPWWTPVIKEAIGGFVQDLFLSNNRTRPSRNLTMGESVATSILKFNGRAQRPPDSSCLRDDTTSFSRTTIWHWIRYSLDRTYHSSSLLSWHVLLSGQLFGAEFSTHCIWSLPFTVGKLIMTISSRLASLGMMTPSSLTTSYLMTCLSSRVEQLLAHGTSCPMVHITLLALSALPDGTK